MARQARIILPGYPHHVTQRGNRRQQTFFCDEDYALYLELMAAACRDHAVQCWAWCLMPNHVHLVLEPADPTGLTAALKCAHQRYTRAINAREGWTGYLWQGRFASCAMDEGHALAAVRYVELNPVRARLCRSAADWRWSSAAWHVGAAASDPLASPQAWMGRIADWPAYLARGVDAAEAAQLGYFTTSGYPLGAPHWVEALEAKLRCRLKPRPVGRPADAARTG